jgi:hypothetical protein
MRFEADDRGVMARKWLEMQMEETINGIRRGGKEEE